jgi:uncharacterized repeat protein (TIGR03943 family)
VNREAQALVMTLLGGAILRISIDDTYLRYVKSGLQPFLIASALVMIVLGVLSAWFDARRPDEDQHKQLPADESASFATDDSRVEHGHADGHDGHSHGPITTRTGWLLLLPVFAIFLIAPPALGAFTAERGGFVGQPQSSYEPLRPGDPVEIPVYEYVGRAIWDGGLSLTDRRIALTGFAVARDDGGWDLARLSLSCCAADALVSRVRVVGDNVQPLPSDTWVRVIGRWTPGGDVKDPRAIPWFEVESIEEIEVPRETYE